LTGRKIKRSGKNPWHRLKRLKWALMVGLALGAMILGVIGFSRYFNDRGTRVHPLSLFYLSLQLFTLESGHIEGQVPWQLEISRYLAPLATIWAAILSLAALLGERLERWRLRRMRDHAVVCGLGRKGLKLTRDFFERGYRVVAIDSNQDSAHLAVCREMGVITLVGDASSGAVLRQARAGHASFVAAVCREDSTNVEVALQTHCLALESGRPSDEPVRCLVHVVDMGLCDLFRRHKVFTETGDAFQASVFNVYSNAARQLLNEHPLDHSQIAPDDPRAPQLIIVGFGIMGEALAIQTARMAHFANGGKPRVSVIDLEAGDREAAFVARCPEFRKACEIEFVKGDIEHKQTLERIHDWVDDPKLVSSVSVCLDDEWRCLKTALRIMSLFEDRNIPVLLRMSEDCRLSELIQEEHDRVEGGAWFHAFGRIEEVCCLDTLLDSDRDALARAIHETYVAKRKSEGKSSEGDPALCPWDELDPARRDFNRLQADHIPVKLRAIGCQAAPGGNANQGDAVGSFTDEEVEVMSRMEHAHYKAKRFLEGWRLGPSDQAAMTNPYLVEWEDLSEELREYDRQFVRRIPEYVALVGKKIYRYNHQGRILLYSDIQASVMEYRNRPEGGRNEP